MAGFAQWSTDELCSWLQEQTKDLNAVEMEGLIKHWRGEGEDASFFQASRAWSRLSALSDTSSKVSAARPL